MIPRVDSDSRFEPDPEELVDPDEVVGLPTGWTVDSPDLAGADVVRLTDLLRDHEREGRGWPGSGREDVLVEVAEPGLRTRQNVVVRDETGLIRAWGSVHDRAVGRMLLVHVVERGLPERVGRACSDVHRRVGGRPGPRGRRRPRSGGPADRHGGVRRRRAAAPLAGRLRLRAGAHVVADEPTGHPRGGRAGALDRGSGPTVGPPSGWSAAATRTGCRTRSDLRAVHDVLEAAFTDHFNSKPETFDEFLHRLREDPGHRWDHWWLASLEDSGEPVGALVATVSESTGGPDGSYVSYIGVVEAARGRGVAKGLLRTVIADAAARGRDRVSLEVDADSSTGADRLYVSMGWETSYVTESWHRDVPVG